MKAAAKNLRAGAALVESCLAIIMLCLILFGILQVSYLVAAKDVISFSAFAACRSATVGMKEEFVNRVVRVTSIPMAGPMVNSPFDKSEPEGQVWDRELLIDDGIIEPALMQASVEIDSIPDYLGGLSGSGLNYYNWLNTGTRISASSARQADGTVEVYVSQNVPLVFPFARAFYRGNIGTMTRQDGTHSVPHSPISAGLAVEDHSVLYLTDEL